MKEYRLDFSSFIHHDNGILEAIVDEGIELTSEMVDEFFNLVRSIEPKVNACLINRKNRYSYTFGANIMLASSNLADYVAVVKYGRLPWPINGIFTPKFFKLGFFDDYEEGMQWLLKKSQKPEH